MITYERLCEVVVYDPSTGVMTNKVTRCNRAIIGTTVGTLTHNGYIEAKIDNVTYGVHRLAWLYVNKVHADFEIDHHDGDRSNNRISNLRLATRKQNNENIKLRDDNKSGHRGVHWYKQTGRWRACVRHHGVNISVGYFADLDEAVKAVQKTRVSLFTHHRLGETL